jgi:SAM-dependent methyltransferase
MLLKPASWLAALLLVLPIATLAQTAAPSFEPQVGQEGKDVIWVPTPPELVDRMLRLAQVTPKDFVVDLGAGDGRIPIAAARMGVRAMGIEYNPEMVDFANRAAAEAGVSAKATIVHGDIFEKDFSKATVVTMYLLTALNLRLRPKLLEMRPGTRLVAHQFGMGEWTPDETSYVEGRPAHLWIVPAKAQGTWNVIVGTPGKSRSFVLQLEQTFQKITGNATFAKTSTTLRHARLQGDAIRFAFTDFDGHVREFSGRVSGERMSGYITGPGGRQRWQATRGG